MSNNQQFLNLYNQLDEQLRKILQVKPQISHASLLEKMARKDSVFAEYHSRLQAYRALRNALVHIPYDGEEPEPIAEPHSSIVEQYEKLVNYVLNPPSALGSIAITTLFTISWADNFFEKIEIMLQNSYRIVPIVENDLMVGLFDINTLAFHIQKRLHIDSTFSVDMMTSFDIFKPMAGFNIADPSNTNQSVNGTHFASQNATIEDIEKKYKDSFQKNQLISVVCITPTGKAFEPILGIVTAHDLPSANGHVTI